MNKHRFLPRPIESSHLKGWDNEFNFQYTEFNPTLLIHMRSLNMINLNQRLLRVLILKQGTLADIGSDHAYLPIYAIQNKICTSAIAGEVIKGPYKAAVNNVAENDLNESIDVRLGDGLAVINHADNIDNITICGMGGPLIASILKEGQEKLTYHPRLILQSNIQTQVLRNVLTSLNYEIIDEVILEEKGIFMKL